MGSKKKTAKKVIKKSKPKKDGSLLKDTILSQNDEVLMIGRVDLVKNNPDFQTAFQVLTEQYIHNLKKVSEAVGARILVKTIIDIK